MIKRIELILKTQNLTPSQFADRLGVQRPVVSHVLSGRNKPSLDFVMKVLSVFPQINTNWLLFGKGTMYAEMAGSDPVPEMLPTPIFTSAQDPQPDLFSVAAGGADEGADEGIEEDAVKDGNDVDEDDSLNFVDTPPASTRVQAQVQTPEPTRIPAQITAQPARNQEKKVEKVVFFYTDGTFKDYWPEA